MSIWRRWAHARGIPPGAKGLPSRFVARRLIRVYSSYTHILGKGALGLGSPIFISPLGQIDGVYDISPLRQKHPGGYAPLKEQVSVRDQRTSFESAFRGLPAATRDKMCWAR